MKIHPYTFYYNQNQDRLFLIVDINDIENKDNIVLLEVKHYPDMDKREVIKHPRAVIEKLITDNALLEVIPFVPKDSIKKI